MDELSELAALFERNKFKRPESMFHPDNHSSMVQELYEGLIAGRFRDETAAAAHFYPDHPKQMAYFGRLKKRLQNRLINTLFFIDVSASPGSSEFSKAYYACHKDYAAFYILVGRNGRRTAVQLAEKTIEKAKHFHFTKIVLDLSRELTYHYSALDFNKEKILYYSSVADEYQQFDLWEWKAQMLYNQLAQNYSQSRASMGKIYDQALLAVKELEPLIDKIKTYRFVQTAFKVLSIRYLAVADYENALQINKLALSFFDENPHLGAKPVVGGFQLQTVACFLQLGNYEQASLFAEKTLKNYEEGTINWYLTMDYYFLTACHSGSYQEAYSIFREAFEHKGFKHLLPVTSEPWHIYQTYIQYFIATGRAQPTPDDPYKWNKFKLAKLLNEVPTFSQDKQGLNISILVIQILFWLHQRDYSAVIDRTDALKAYAHRYLREDETYRSNCFIKILETLSSTDFHKLAVLRKAQKYYDLMRARSMDIAKPNAEIEIVPYETLWEFLMQDLDEEFHPVRKRKSKDAS